MLCVLDAFFPLLTTVVKNRYFTYCSLPVWFNQSGQSPLVSLINKAFPLAEQQITECFLLYTLISVNCCVWQSNNFLLGNIKTSLSGTNSHVRVIVSEVTFSKIHSFFLCDQLKRNWISVLLPYRFVETYRKHIDTFSDPGSVITLYRCELSD